MPASALSLLREIARFSRSERHHQHVAHFAGPAGEMVERYGKLTKRPLSRENPQRGEPSRHRQLEITMRKWRLMLKCAIDAVYIIGIRPEINRIVRKYCHFADNIVLLYRIIHLISAALVGGGRGLGI